MEEGIKLSYKQAMYIISLFLLNTKPLHLSWAEFIKKLKVKNPNKVKEAGDGFFVIPLGAGKRRVKKCLAIYGDLASKRVSLVIYNKVFA